MGKIEIEYNGDRMLDNLHNIKTKMQIIKTPQDDKGKHYLTQITETADRAIENIKFYKSDSKGNKRADNYKEMIHEFSNIYATLKGLIFLLKIRSDEDDAKILSDLEKEINILVGSVASHDVDQHQEI